MDTLVQPLPMTQMALLLGHLLGDFPLQSKWISRNKGTSARALALHGLLHFALAWACLLVFTQIAWRSVPAQLLLIGSTLIHLVIDKLKHFLTARGASANPKVHLAGRGKIVRLFRRIVPSRPASGFLDDDWKTFLLDQLLHVAVAAITAALLTGSNLGLILAALKLSPAVRAQILAAAIVYTAVIFGGGYLIRYLTRGLAREAVTESKSQMENAGLYLGWIERFLVLTAIAMQSPLMVGLILTGKSIARFPEMKEARFAEYFLIGTLLSICIAVVGGVGLLLLLYGRVTLK